MPRKPTNLWKLVGVTYGAVVVVTIMALVGYHYMSSGAKQDGPERAGNFTVGTVWISLYPGAVVHDRISTRNAGATEGSLKFSSTDPPESVLAFYRTTLHKSRFILEGNTDARTVRAIGRAGKVSVIVTADPAGTGSEAQISTVNKGK